MGIISEIFKVITEGIKAFTGALGDAIVSVGEMFYTPADGLTLLGVLCVMSIAIAIVYWVFRLIKGLVHKSA